MQAAVGAKPAADFAAVPGVEVARIDPASGLRADDGAAAAAALSFLAGTAPAQTARSQAGAAPQNFFMDDR
jgi:hypothetical protein